MLLAPPPSSELESKDMGGFRTGRLCKPAPPTALYRHEAVGKTHAEKEERGSVPKLDGEHDEMCVHPRSQGGGTT